MLAEKTAKKQGKEPIGERFVDGVVQEPIGEGFAGVSDPEPIGEGKLSTLDVKPRRGEMIKPGELIDIVEVTPLNLTDRRVFNILLENAWPEIGMEETRHTVRWSHLREATTGRHNNDRVEVSIERLMTAIVRLEYVDKNGKWRRDRFQLLGSNTVELDEAGEAKASAEFGYTFDRKLLRVLQSSTMYGRLETQVLAAFSSKYSLALYELVSRRKNLSYITSEEFELARLRDLMGVPKGKLEQFGHFKDKALKPALLEVNALADFEVSFTPGKTGRKVTHVTLSWLLKDKAARKASRKELESSSVGRKTRIKETAEQTGPSGAGSRREPKSETFEKLAATYPGYDIDWVYREEYEPWLRSNNLLPRDVNAHFMFFIQKKAERDGWKVS